MTLFPYLGLEANGRAWISPSPGRPWTRYTKTTLDPNHCVVSVDIHGIVFNTVLTPQSQRTSIGTEMCVSTSLALPWYSILNLRWSNTMAPTQIQRNCLVLSCPLQTKRREISAHLWGFHGHFLISCAATTSALTWQKGKFAGRQDVGEGREMSQEVDVSPKHHLQGRRKFCW